MKKSVLHLLFACAACSALLCSCGILDVLFSSYFSPTLTNIESRYDLSSLIPEGTGDLYSFAVETAGSVPADYPLLFTHENTGGPAIIVLDGSLAVIRQEDSGIYADGFNGGSTMTDAQGRIIVGNAVFDPSSGADIFVDAGLPVSLYGYSSSISAAGISYNVVNTQINGSIFLSIDLYDPSWTTSYALSDQVVGDSMLYQLLAAHADAQDSILRLIIKDVDTGISYCTSIPFADIPTSFAASLPDDLLVVYPPTLTLPVVQGGANYAFVDGLLFAYDSWDRDTSVYDLGTGVVTQTLHDPAFYEHLRTAYTESAFYVLDTEGRTLTKYRAWWRR